VDEEIIHLPRLAPLIENGLFRACAHAGGADFVNDCPTRHDRFGAVELRFLYHSPSHGTDDLAERSSAVRRLPRFVFTPFPMKTEHGDSPFVFFIGIDFAEAIVVRIISPRPAKPMNEP
jgi:hypothetical protein